MDVDEGQGEHFFASYLSTSSLLKLSVPNFHSSYIPIGFRMEQKVDFLFQYLRTLVAIGSVAAGRSFTVCL